MYLLKIYKAINFILKKLFPNSLSLIKFKNILLCLKDIYFTHLKIKEDNSYQLNSLWAIYNSCFSYFDISTSVIVDFICSSLNITFLKPLHPPKIFYPSDSRPWNIFCPP